MTKPICYMGKYILYDNGRIYSEDYKDSRFPMQFNSPEEGLKYMEDNRLDNSKW